MVGDLNLSIDPQIDTTGGPSRYTVKRQKAVKKLLLEHQLVDTWRVRHPGNRDYTFYSPVHGSFSRIDYIFIQHQLLQSLKCVEIKAITLSDHAPVAIKLEILNNRMGRNWRLNNSLIQDLVIIKIEQELENFFAVNDTPEILRSALWEAHKAVMREILIGAGAGKKRERAGKLCILYGEIQDFEQMTRPQGIPERQELVVKRVQLADLLEQLKKKRHLSYSKQGEVSMGK